MHYSRFDHLQNIFFFSFFLLFYKLIKREDKKESDIYEQIHEDNTRECRM